MSIGLLLSVMVVPLAHYWEYENTVIYCLFAAGVLLLLAGIIKNQWQLVPPEKENEKESLEE